jgi:hypothetical protein
VAEYDDFLPGINIHIGNEVPRLAMLYAVKSVVRKFCDESKIWVHDCSAIDVIQEQLMYPLDVPNDSVICKVWSITGRKDIGDYYQCPAHHIQFNNQLVFDADLPNNLKQLAVVVSLTTKQDSLTCPDFLYQNYHDAIVSGAVASLQMMPARAWSEPNMAAVHQQNFDDFVKKAISDRDDGFGLARRPTRVRPHYL